MMLNNFPPEGSATASCTCHSMATGEPCRAIWHAREETPADEPRNRHERRREAKLRRSGALADA